MDCGGDFEYCRYVFDVKILLRNVKASVRAPARDNRRYLNCVGKNINNSKKGVLVKMVRQGFDENRITKKELCEYRSIVAELKEISGNNNQNADLLKRLEKRVEKTERFIQNIPDSMTRRIFRYRYIDGKVKPSWQWIAVKLGGSNSADSARMIHNRYLKSVDNKIIK